MKNHRREKLKNYDLKGWIVDSVPVAPREEPLVGD